MSQVIVHNEQNKLIIHKAREMGIGCRPLIPGCEDFLELSYKGKEIIINKTRSHKLPLLSGLLAQNKDASSLLLRRSGLPVPEYVVVSRMCEEAAAFLMNYQSVVVKPLDGRRSEGVTLGIGRLDDLDDAIETASASSSRVIIQKYVEGSDYRVLVIDGKVAGVTEYKPAIVEGDGYSTIEQLIRRLNEAMNRHNKAGGFQRVETVNTDSEIVRSSLEKQEKRLQSIPGKGEQIQLFSIENVPAGKISEIHIDRTEEICAFNANVAIEAARALHIDVAGIDIRCPDISVPLHPSNGGVLEVNALPDMVDHVYPYQGASRDVVKEYLQYLFKE